MTNEQVLEMISMRMNGATLQEIGAQFSVSRKEMRRYLPPTLFPRRMGNTKKTHERNIYPNIRDWMLAHEYTYGELNRLVNGKSATTTINKLTGKTEPDKSFIDKVLGITGMTYEVAFSHEIHAKT